MKNNPFKSASSRKYYFQSINQLALKEKINGNNNVSDSSFFLRRYLAGLDLLEPPKNVPEKRHKDPITPHFFSDLARQLNNNS